MPLRITFLVLTIAAYALATEIPITTQPRIGSGAQSFEAIATDGKSFLVVEGAGVFGGHYDDFGFEASLVNPDGTPLKAPFGLGDSIGQSVAAASSGNGYLVVINDRGNAGGIRISSQGDVLDAKPFAIGGLSPGNLSRGPISVAWDGTAYVVVWGSFEPALKYAYVSENGDVQSTGTVGPNWGSVAARNGVSLIATETSSSIAVQTMTPKGITEPIALTATRTGFTIAAGADDFLAVWTYVGSAYAQHVNSAGQPTGQPVTLPAIQPDAIIATWDGTSYVVVWLNGTDVRALRIATDGTAGRPFDVSTDPNLKNAVGVAASQGHTEVVMRSSSAMTLKSIDASNNVSPPSSQQGPYAFPYIAGQYNVHAVFNGVDYLVFWDEDHSRYGRTSTTGQRLDGAGLPSQFSVLDAAAGSGLTLVVFTRENTVRVARIDASGVILDDPGIELDSFPAIRARVLWDGSEFVVFWTESTLSTSLPRGTLAARISVDGTIIDSPPRQVFPYGLDFEVAKSKDHYQLAYADGVGFATKVTVVTISSDLQLATASHTLSLPTEKVNSFSIASNGEDFLIAWNNDAEEIVGQWASWAAEPIGPRIVYSEDANKKGRPQAVFDGNEFVVTWPELEQSRFVFNSRRIDASAAQDVGPLLTIASGPLLPGLTTQLLQAWSYVSAPIPAVAYSRPDQVGVLPWQRTFIQEAFSARHHVVSR